ncbi:MAG: hypothetical protein IPI48_03795 [bacterium]|nr:hypothetical protein [bacterium]
MRRSLLMLAVLALLVAAGSAFAATTVIRTGQVGGVPGLCGGNDDPFRFYAPNQTCGQPILPTPFAPADFAEWRAGPPASVITIPSVPPDREPALRSRGALDRHWSRRSRLLSGADVSTLFCAPFDSGVRHCRQHPDLLGRR